MKRGSIKAWRLAGALGVLIGMTMAVAQAADKAAAAAGKGMALSFGGTEYLHRWSKDDQNEFTPREQSDLSRWTDMVTINVHPKVATGDQLAELANAVLGNYQASGKILQTNSKPRTDKQEAEHFVAALLGAEGVREAAFARFVLVDGVGVIVVRSHRVYGTGPEVGATIGKWLEANGATTEAELMEWKGIPRIAELKKLPQAK